MPSLFDPLVAGDLNLANRVVMAPLTRNRSPNAVPKPITATYYAQRATAGLLVTEATAISHQGQGYADVPGLYGADQLEGWKRVTDAVHAAGGRIVVQIWHVGRVSHTSLQPNGGAPVAPSAITAKSKTYVIDADGKGAFMPTSAPRALGIEELPGIVADYRKAVRAAVDAGFDGVELHAANGYLIDEFLCDRTNKRTDRYCGGIENRGRFLMEVVAAVSAAVGAERTGVRISPQNTQNDIADSDPQSLFNYVAGRLSGKSLAYLHIIEGDTSGAPVSPFDYKNLKRLFGGLVIANNGFDKRRANDAIAEEANRARPDPSPLEARPRVSTSAVAERPRQRAPPAVCAPGRTRTCAHGSGGRCSIR